jgi:hypothetical protein
MLSLLYVIPFFLALAIIMWVYFDATELGKPAIPWAIAQPMLWWLFFLPLLLYAIFREQGQRRVVPPGGARRQAVYILSFIGYSGLAYGLAVVVGATIVRLGGDVGSGTYKDVLASSLAAAIIGGLIWAVVWPQAGRRLGNDLDDSEFWATFYLHRAYLYTVFGVSWLVAALAGMWILGGVIGSIVGAGTDFGTWAWALGPLAVAFAAIAFHYFFVMRTPAYQQLVRRCNSSPEPAITGATSAPVAAPASAGSRAPGVRHFCPRCGAPVGPTDTFCSSCGMNLNPA